MIENMLCNGLVKNNNPKSPIQYFEIITVREYNDYEGGTITEQIKNASQLLTDDWAAIDEPFYQIYGKRYIDDIRSGPILLGTFDTLYMAKEFLYNITGEIPQIISIDYDQQ